MVYYDNLVFLGGIMKRFSVLFLALIMVVGFTVTAYAALVDMNDGTIYDTDTQLSWLKDAGASGNRNWSDAKAWAEGLNIGGLTGWRLPVADPACSGYNCTNSEMGHLYYTELGNAAGGPLTNTGPFINLQTTLNFQSGTEYAPDPTGAWYFYFLNGSQNAFDKNGNAYALAVRSGARAISDPPTPVPATGTTALIIILFGLMIMSGMRLRYSKK